MKPTVYHVYYNKMMDNFFVSTNHPRINAGFIMIHMGSCEDRLQAENIKDRLEDNKEDVLRFMGVYSVKAMKKSNRERDKAKKKQASSGLDAAAAKPRECMVGEGSPMPKGLIMMMDIINNGQEDCPFNTVDAGNILEISPDMTPEEIEDLMNGQDT